MPPLHCQFKFLLADVESSPKIQRPRAMLARCSLALALLARARAADWTAGAPGVGRAGFDLNGSPVALPSAAAAPCGALCAATRGCVVWAIDACGGGPTYNCSLKFGAPNATLDACATSGFAPRALAPRAHAPLALGATAPAGWLRAQLQLEADGLTGHLSDFYPDVQNSSWVGGTLPRQTAERFSYCTFNATTLIPPATAALTTLNPNPTRAPRP